MERHWVEELFPPHFTYALDQSAKTRSPDSKDNKNDSDLGHIQALYNRVRIDVNGKEKEGQDKCLQIGEPLAEHRSPKSSSDGALNDAKRSLSSAAGDECIWTAKEMAILRKATQEAKRENTKLNAKLSILTKQNEKLAQKCKQQTAALTVKNSKIHEKSQELERLGQSCHHLQTELQHSHVAVRLHEEDIADFRESKHNLKRQLKAIQQELGEEKLLREKLERQVKQTGKQTALENAVREDGIRLDYQRQINRLYEELEGVKTELAKEKTENVTMRKALDHLRIHFANFPSNNEKDPCPSKSSRIGKLDLY